MRDAIPNAGPRQDHRTNAEVAQAVYRTHGFAGLTRLQQDAGVDDDVTDLRDLLEDALGLIVPSQTLFDRLRDVFGEPSAALLTVASGAPADLAASWCAAICRFESGGPRRRELRLVDSIAEVALGEPPLNSADLERCAIAIAAHRPRLGPPRLYLDISELAQRDARTGIQRVVRGVLAELLHKPPRGYRVEPVREDGRGRYAYARPQALRLLGLPPDWLHEEPVEAREGDVFLGLDLFADGIARVEDQLVQWRARGVRLHFVVYDLLPVNLPTVFAPELGPVFGAWLGLLSFLADGIICISRAVADDYLAWIATRPPARATPVAVGHFPLGASFDDTHPTRGLPAGAKDALARLAERPSFLMVGTVEPRKAHGQALAAFEQLWKRGIDANLVIVGKEGWMTAPFAQGLRSHREFDRRLFWFEGVSDEMLERVYKASTALLSASLGEGFGLPLVEAAHRGLPLIARDLAVFREVAGDKAYYFSGEDPTDLARAVEAWLELWRAGRAPDSRGIRSLTWAESASRLMDVVLGGASYAQWHAGSGTVFTPEPAITSAQATPDLPREIRTTCYLRMAP